MPGTGGGGEGGHRWGAGPLVAPHRLQKYNTKEFNPCALITKDPDSTSPRIPRSERRAGTCLPEKAPLNGDKQPKHTATKQDEPIGVCHTGWCYHVEFFDYPPLKIPITSWNDRISIHYRWETFEWQFPEASCVDKSTAGSLTQTLRSATACIATK